MDGDFKGDFTRDTFRPVKHYSRVLMQQGRVQLDADWNEQADILTYALRKLTEAIIGPYGGPDEGSGFQITAIENNLTDFNIGAGDYYVDGILVENDDRGADGKPAVYTYAAQAYVTQTALSSANQDFQLIYLDVWEQQVTYLEDEFMREVALGEGRPDTAARARIMWQVGVMGDKQFTQGDLNLANVVKGITGKKSPDKATLVNQVARGLIEVLQPANPNRGQLRARAKITAPDADTCNISPDSKYRGDENQLYRVEIHNDASTKGGATFKWSRDNGSVVLPIKGIETGDKTSTVTIGNLGRDERLSVEDGDWVEIVDRGDVPQVPPHPLLKVNKVDKTNPLNIQLTLDGAIDYASKIVVEQFPVLRRWDQRQRATKKGGEPDLFDRASGTLKIVEGSGEGKDDIKEHWITLEDGVQVQFQLNNPTANYRSGDYWLIPARTITGDVEWPMQTDQHIALSPQGVEHHYAPLAIIQPNANKSFDVTDLRFVFKSLAQPI